MSFYRPSLFNPGDRFHAADPSILGSHTRADHIVIRDCDPYDPGGRCRWYVMDEDGNTVDKMSGTLSPAQLRPYSPRSSHTTSSSSSRYTWTIPYLDPNALRSMLGPSDAQSVSHAPKPEKKEKILLDSVVMADEKKQQIRAAMAQLEHHDLIFKKWGFGEVFEKGTAVSLLFYGGPGTGKTLCAQAIADSLDLTLKVIQTAEVESSEPGQCERNIKAFFENAVKQKQLLLFDECDSLICERGDVGMILAAQINALLTALEHYTGVVVFTTNRLGNLDPAFERRISAKIEFEFPSEEQRLLIWQRLLPKKAPVCKKIDLKLLAKAPIPGGNIKNAVLSAARYAAFLGKKVIDEECFTHGIRKEVEGMKGFHKAIQNTKRLPHPVGYARTDMGISKELTQDKVPVLEKLAGDSDFFSPPSR